MSATESLRPVATLLAEPHHDGSDAYVLERPDELGGDARRPRCACRAGAADEVVAPLRRRRRAARRRGGASTTRRSRDAGGARRFPVDRARDALPLAARPAATVGYAWVNGLGVVAHDVPDADDFVLAAEPRRAGLAPRARSSTRSSPTGSRRAGSRGEAPDWAVRARVGRAADRARARNAARVLRRRPARGRGSTSTTSRRSART